MKDPLNFYYQYKLSTALALTEGVLNWDWNIGSTQWFYDANCDAMDRTRTSALGYPRWHTRLDQAASYPNITASPMHHDILVGVCDVADSFNSARDHAKDVYQAAGYFVPYTYTGNTRAILQCDGRYVASDGYYARVYE